MGYTKNFSETELTRSDYAIRHGINNEPVDDYVRENLERLAKYLQSIRDALCYHYKRDVSINVSSAYRSPAVNSAVGGSRSSAHMQGLAADITANGLTVQELFDFIAQNFGYDQLINEFGAWVHVSMPSPSKKRMQKLAAVKSGGKTVYATVA